MKRQLLLSRKNKNNTSKGHLLKFLFSKQRKLTFFSGSVSNTFLISYIKSAVSSMYSSTTPASQLVFPAKPIQYVFKLGRVKRKRIYIILHKHKVSSGHFLSIDILLYPITLFGNREGPDQTVHMPKDTFSHGSAQLFIC